VKSWLECYRDPLGTIYVDETLERDSDHGRLAVRLLVMRGGVALTAYVGVPPDAPAAGWGEELVPLEVHGGLTFAGAGGDGIRPDGWWWYGWDYGHAFDATWVCLDLVAQGIEAPRFPGDVEWTIEMVAPEARAAADQMMALLVAGWRPSAEATAEQEERDRSQEQYRRDVADGTASKRLEGELAKMQRLRELNG